MCEAVVLDMWTASRVRELKRALGMVLKRDENGDQDGVHILRGTRYPRGDDGHKLDSKSQVLRFGHPRRYVAHNIENFSSNLGLALDARILHCKWLSL